MADESADGTRPETAPAGNGSDASAQQSQTPSMPMVIRGQYIKDLSFENPGAPQSLAGLTEAPDVQLDVNVNARQLSASDYEVTLALNATARSGQQPLFVAELVYAGVFTFNNLPPEHLQPMLLIEAPRQLFPFARNIIADTTRDGGFPPLMVQPLDFVALYQQRLQQQEPDAAAPATAPQA